jgi:hypothetical protein
LPLVEDAAKRRDLDGEVIVLDDRSRPDSSHDLVLWDEIPIALNKDAEHVEGSRADHHRDEDSAFIAPGQAAPIETEALEQENVAAGTRLHAPSPAAASETGDDAKPRLWVDLPDKRDFATFRKI